MTTTLTGFVELTSDIPTVQTAVDAVEGATLRTGQKGLLGQTFHIDLEDAEVLGSLLQSMLQVCLPNDAHWAIATLRPGDRPADVYEGPFTHLLHQF